MNPLNPKKLLLTKWTAVKPVAKQKHFLVSRVIQPDLPTAPRAGAYGLTRLRLPNSHLKLKSKNQKIGATPSSCINQSTA